VQAVCTTLDLNADGEQVLHDLEENIGVMENINEDVAYDNLEEEMDDEVNEVNDTTDEMVGPLMQMHQKETLFLIKKVCLNHFDSSIITHGVCQGVQVVRFALALCRSDQKSSALFESTRISRCTGQLKLSKYAVTLMLPPSTDTWRTGPPWCGYAQQLSMTT